MESLQTNLCMLLARVPVQKYAGACTLLEAPKSGGDSRKARAVAWGTAPHFNRGSPRRGSWSQGRGLKKSQRGWQGVLVTVPGSERGFLCGQRRDQKNFGEGACGALRGSRRLAASA